MGMFCGMGGMPGIGGGPPGRIVAPGGGGGGRITPGGGPLVCPGGAEGKSAAYSPGDSRDAA